MSTKDYAYLIFCLLLNTFLLWTVLTRVEKLKKVQSYAVRINTDPPIFKSLFILKPAGYFSHRGEITKFGTMPV